MAMEVPSWLIPKETPWDAFVKGAAAGSAIAANRLHGQQIYAQVQQSLAHQDLAERELAMQNEAQTLHNEALRTKMTNDAEDLATLRDWYPKFAAAKGDALADIELPTLNNPQMTKNVAAVYMQKRQIHADGELAGAIADSTRNGFTMDDPETIAAVAEVGRKWPEVVGTPAWNKTFDYAAKARAASNVYDYQQGVLEVKRAEEERKKGLTANGIPTENLEVVKDDTSGAHFYARGGKWYHLPQSLVPADKPIPSATIAQKTTIYRDQIKELEGDLSSAKGLRPSELAKPEMQAHIKDIEARLSAARARRDALVEPGAAQGLNTTLKVPAPANPADRQTGKVYVTPKGEFLWNGTGWVTP